MTSLGIIIAAVLAGLLFLAVIGIVAWQINKGSRQAEQQAYEAQLRAWQIQQQEHETEQRVRAATRAALNHMLWEARRASGMGGTASGPNSPGDHDAGGSNTSGGNAADPDNPFGI